MSFTNNLYINIFCLLCNNSLWPFGRSVVEVHLPHDPVCPSVSQLEYDCGRQTLGYPIQFVYKALCIAESVLRCELEKDWLGKKYFFDYVNIKICNYFVSIHSVMMKQMDNHCYELLKEQHDESSLFSLFLVSLSLSLSLSLFLCPFNFVFLSHCFLKFF